LNQRRLAPTGLQPVCESSQVQAKQQLSNKPNKRLQTSLQKNPENGQNQGQKLPPELAEIVAVWPDLPEHIKAAVMALIQTHKR